MAVRYEPLTLPVVPDNRPNYVTVSPDGRYVFAGFNAASIHSSVLTFEASGGSVRQLDLSSIFPSGVTSYAAEFSPDGQWLAVGLADSERFKIFKVDGGLFQEVPLNNKPTLAVPRRIWWSLDSSRVAMVTGANRLEVLTKDAGESFTFVQQGSATIYNYSSVGRGAFSDDNLSCFVPFTSTMEEGEWWKFDGTTYVEQGAQVAPYPAFSYARLPGDRIIGVTSTRTVPQFRVFTGTGFQGDTSAYSVTIGAQSDVRVLGKRVFVTLWNDLANPLYVYELDDNYDWVGPPTRAERFETVSRPYYRGLAGSEDGAILATVEEQSPYLSIHIDETKISKVVYPGFGLSGSLDFIMTPRTGEGSLPIPALTSDGFLGTAEHEEAIAVPKIVASPVTAAVAKGPDISSDESELHVRVRGPRHTQACH